MSLVSSLPVNDELDGLTSDSGSDSEFVPHDDDSDSSTSSDTSEEEADLSGVAEGFYCGKDGTQWAFQPPQSSRVPQRNILRGPLKRVVYADHVTEEVHAFNLLITETLLKDIVECTNLEERRIYDEKETLITK